MLTKSTLRRYVDQYISGICFPEINGIKICLQFNISEECWSTLFQKQCRYVGDPSSCIVFQFSSALHASALRPPPCEDETDETATLVNEPLVFMEAIKQDYQEEARTETKDIFTAGQRKPDESERCHCRVALASAPSAANCRQLRWRHQLPMGTAASLEAAWGQSILLK